MFIQRLMTLGIVLMMLTLGLAGVVTALPSLSQFVPDPTELAPVPLHDDSTEQAETDSGDEGTSERPASRPASPRYSRLTKLNSWFQAGVKGEAADGTQQVVRLHVIFIDDEHSISGRISMLSGPMETFGLDGEPLSVHLLRDGAMQSE